MIKIQTDVGKIRDSILKEMREKILEENSKETLNKVSSFMTGYVPSIAPDIFYIENIIFENVVLNSYSILNENNYVRDKFIEGCLKNNDRIKTFFIQSVKDIMENSEGKTEETVGMDNVMQTMKSFMGKDTGTKDEIYDRFMELLKEYLETNENDEKLRLERESKSAESNLNLPEFVASDVKNIMNPASFENITSWYAKKMDENNAINSMIFFVILHFMTSAINVKSLTNGIINKSIVEHYFPRIIGSKHYHKEDVFVVTLLYRFLQYDNKVIANVSKIIEDVVSDVKEINVINEPKIILKIDVWFKNYYLTKYPIIIKNLEKLENMKREGQGQEQGKIMQGGDGPIAPAVNTASNTIQDLQKKYSEALKAPPNTLSGMYSLAKSASKDFNANKGQFLNKDNLLKMAESSGITLDEKSKGLIDKYSQYLEKPPTSFRDAYNLGKTLMKDRKGIMEAVKSVGENTGSNLTSNLGQLQSNFIKGLSNPNTNPNPNPNPIPNTNIDNVTPNMPSPNLATGIMGPGAPNLIQRASDAGADFPSNISQYATQIGDQMKNMNMADLSKHAENFGSQMKNMNMADLSKHAENFGSQMKNMNMADLSKHAENFGSELGKMDMSQLSGQIGNIGSQFANQMGNVDMSQLSGQMGNVMDMAKSISPGALGNMAGLASKMGGIPGMGGLAGMGALAGMAGMSGMESSGAKGNGSGISMFDNNKKYLDIIKANSNELYNAYLNSLNEFLDNLITILKEYEFENTVNTIITGKITTSINKDQLVKQQFILKLFAYMKPLLFEISKKAIQKDPTLNNETAEFIVKEYLKNINIENIDELIPPIETQYIMTENIPMDMQLGGEKNPYGTVGEGTQNAISFAIPKNKPSLKTLPTSVQSPNIHSSSSPPPQKDNRPKSEIAGIPPLEYDRLTKNILFMFSKNTSKSSIEQRIVNVFEQLFNNAFNYLSFNIDLYKMVTRKIEQDFSLYVQDVIKVLAGTSEDVVHFFHYKLINSRATENVVSTNNKTIIIKCIQFAFSSYHKIEQETKEKVGFDIDDTLLNIKTERLTNEIMNSFANYYDIVYKPIETTQMGGNKNRRKTKQKMSLLQRNTRKKRRNA
jgi:hypothetical protein